MWRLFNNTYETKKIQLFRLTPEFLEQAHSQLEGKIGLFSGYCQAHGINLMLRGNYIRSATHLVLLAAVNRTEGILTVLWNFLEGNAAHVKLNGILCAPQR